MGEPVFRTLQLHLQIVQLLRVRNRLVATFEVSPGNDMQFCVVRIVFQFDDFLGKYEIIIRKTKNSSFKNEKSKKEVDVTITVSNKDIV